MANVLAHLFARVFLLGALSLCFGQVPNACRWKAIGGPEDVGGVVTSGVLRSPSLPGVSGYPEKLDCVWRIWAGFGKKIQLRISYMDLPPREPDGKCSEDFLIVRDLSGNQHWTFCGQEKTTCLISSGRDFHVNFVTSAKPNKKLRHFRGWAMEYSTVEASDRCPTKPTAEAPLTTPPVGRVTKGTKSDVVTSGHVPTYRGCEGAECSANLTTTDETGSSGGSSAVVIFLALTVAILCLAGLVCLGWWCWNKRRNDTEKRQRPADELGPHPDVITFRVGEEKTSLMDANYGKPVGPVPSKNYGKPVGPVPSKPARKTADCPFPVQEEAEWKRLQEPLISKRLKEGGVETSPPPVPPTVGRYVIHDVTPYGYSDVLLRDRIETQQQQPYPDPCYAEIDEGIVKVGERKEEPAAPVKPARGSYPPYATVYKPGNLEAPVKPKRAPPPKKSPRKSLNPAKPDVIGDVTNDSSGCYEVPMVTTPPRKPPRSFPPKVKKAGIINFPGLSDGSDDDGYAVPIGTVTTAAADQSKVEYDRLGGNGSHDNGSHDNGDYHHLGEGSNDYDHLARGIVDQRKQRGQMSDYDRLPEVEAQ
ncbi:uncharacterized protein LOC144908984 [Branchiostoma floridae x Branchiostoma belcheri]